MYRSYTPISTYDNPHSNCIIEIQERNDKIVNKKIVKLVCRNDRIVTEVFASKIMVFDGVSRKTSYFTKIKIRQYRKKGETKSGIEYFAGIVRNDQYFSYNPELAYKKMLNIYQQCVERHDVERRFNVKTVDGDYVDLFVCKLQ